MPNIFFTSDNHFSHHNIIKYCDRPWGNFERFKGINEEDMEDDMLQDYKNELFSASLKMNEEMIKRHNEVVGPKDWVFNLGDFFCGKSAKEAEEVFHALNGKKFLIKGNHDKKITFKLPWERQYDILYLKIRSVPGWQNHKDEVFLSHYSHRVWNKSFHGVGHLWGHSHGGMDFYKNSFDVGVDCHNFYPISWEKVKKYFEAIEVLNAMNLDADSIRKKVSEDDKELISFLDELESEEIFIRKIISKYGRKHETSENL